MHRSLLIALALARFLSCAPSDEDTRRWLAEADRLGHDMSASGERNRHLKQEFALLQSLAYARLGDGDATRRHLTFPERNGSPNAPLPPELRYRLREVHEALFGALAARGEAETAIAYALDLEPHQRTLDLYVRLGYHFDDSALGKTLEDSDLLHFRLGTVWRKLDNGDTEAARRELERIRPEKRASAEKMLSELLLLEGAWQTAADLHRTIGISAEACRRIRPLPNERKGTIEFLKKLGDEVPEPCAAQLTMLLAGTGALEEARAVFQRTESKTERWWESVAWQLQEYDWLATHHEHAEDPTRQAERYWRFARRYMERGDRTKAAAYAERSLDAVLGPGTGRRRDNALALLAGFHATMGSPDMVKKLADMIREAASEERQRALAELPVAYAVAGDPEAAIRSARQLDDLSVRVESLARSAARLDAGTEPYSKLTEAARTACSEISEPFHAAKAWRFLTEEQLKAGDIEGAEESASRAGESGAGNPSWKAILEHHLKNGQLEQASNAADQMVDEEGQAHHQRALEEVCVAAARAGDTQRARALVDRIENPHIQAGAAHALVAGLVEAGRYDAAVEIARTIGRNREGSVELLVRSRVTAGELPDAELLNGVLAGLGARGSSHLCWAAVAASNHSASRLESWIAELDTPGCQALAYSGAAFSRLADSDPEAPFSMFTRGDAIVARAMEFSRRRVIFGAVPR